MPEEKPGEMLGGKELKGQTEIILKVQFEYPDMKITEI